MSELIIGRIEQLYKDKPNRFDHWLVDVDKEITGGDLIKAYIARIQEVEEKLGAAEMAMEERALIIQELEDKLTLKMVEYDTLALEYQALKEGE